MDISEAVKVLTDAIRNDKELYYSYQANIAMSFWDVYIHNTQTKYKNKKRDIHEIANTAAKKFLDLWSK